MLPLYLTFLQHIAEIKPSKHFDIDFTAQKLLDIIACCHYFEPLTVTEAMSLREIGSPATVHRKLNDLLIAGLVVHEFDGENRRTKYLRLTTRAVAYYMNLSTTMAEVTHERTKP
jgi:DNA-binding MarR family transcriptional regulator